MDAIQGLYPPETYTIGFTENRYSSMDDENLSPSPTDHTLGYNSSALDYAERTNKGAENIFLGKSISLDKMRHKSVGRINNDILDLVFELTERRKTPFLSRSFKEDWPRCDSELSNCSSVSFNSSSSDPKVVVQQLPPREQCVLPDINNNTNNIKADEKEMTKKKRNKKKRNDNSNKRTEGKSANEALPKLRGIINTVIEQNKSKKADKALNDDKQDQAGLDSNTDATDKSGFNSTGVSKWQFITEKLVEANKLVREGSLEIDRYRGRYHSPGYSSDTKRRLSYCQSSYDERAERQRINNIRRRHISHTTTGPLDFNKLKRQITTGRSKSFVW